MSVTPDAVGDETRRGMGEVMHDCQASPDAWRAVYYGDDPAPEAAAEIAEFAHETANHHMEQGNINEATDWRQMAQSAEKAANGGD